MAASCMAAGRSPRRSASPPGSVVSHFRHGIASVGAVVDTVEKLLMGIYFYPRGGSAHSARALARQLEVQGLEVTLLSGSRTDLGPVADARAFYAGLDVRP